MSWPNRRGTTTAKTPIASRRVPRPASSAARLKARCVSLFLLGGDEAPFIESDYGGAQRRAMLAAMRRLSWWWMRSSLWSVALSWQEIASAYGKRAHSTIRMALRGAPSLEEASSALCFRNALALWEYAMSARPIDPDRFAPLPRLWVAAMASRVAPDAVDRCAPMLAKWAVGGERL